MTVLHPRARVAAAGAAGTVLLAMLAGPMAVTADADPGTTQIPSTGGSDASGSHATAAVVQGYRTRYATVSLTARRQGSVTATCPAGTRAIAGGLVGVDGNAGLLVNGTFPLSDGSGWRVYANNVATSTKGATAVVLCAANLPSYHVVTGGQIVNPSKTQTQATVGCPTGTVPYGGGGVASSTALTVNLNSSIPLSKGWRVDVNNNSAATNQASASVVCGAAPMGYQQVIHQGGSAASAGSSAIDDATCPAGTNIIGGGGYANSLRRSVNLTQTWPGFDDNDQLADLWRSGITNPTKTSTLLTSYAVCAAATD